MQTFITVNFKHIDILENIRDMISDNGYIYINNAHFQEFSSIIDSILRKCHSYELDLIASRIKLGVFIVREGLQITDIGLLSQDITNIKFNYEVNSLYDLFNIHIKDIENAFGSDLILNRFPDPPYKNLPDFVTPIPPDVPKIPIATKEILGLFRVDNNLIIDISGVLSTNVRKESLELNYLIANNIDRIESAFGSDLILSRFPEPVWNDLPDVPKIPIATRNSLGYFKISDNFVIDMRGVISQIVDGEKFNIRINELNKLTLSNIDRINNLIGGNLILDKFPNPSYQNLPDVVPEPETPDIPILPLPIASNDKLGLFKIGMGLSINRLQNGLLTQNVNNKSIDNLKNLMEKSIINNISKLERFFGSDLILNRFPEPEW